MRFKVGDQVIIARVDPYFSEAPSYNDYLKMIGGVHNIINIDNNEYHLDCKMYQCWKESEVEDAKSYIINQVLNEL